MARAHARENAQLRAKNASLTHRNARLIWLARAMYRTEQRVLDEADDTVWCGSSETLRDAMDAQMSVMKDLGCQPDDHDMRARELGWTVVK